MNQPRKGGSYIRDPKTGAVITVFQPEQPQDAAKRRKAEAADHRAKRLSDRPSIPAEVVEPATKTTVKKGAADVA